MFLNTTTHFHIDVSWEWTYDGYHKEHKTKIYQNMCGIMYYAMLYSISGRQKVLGFYSYLYTVTLAHMWLLNNLSSVVKNVIIVKHNTSAIGKTCPSVVFYCFLKYLRECQEIVIFQKSYPFFVLFQTARTLLILTLHWKALLFWKCLYPYFNFKWLFDVATEVKILLWHTYFNLITMPGAEGGSAEDIDMPPPPPPTPTHTHTHTPHHTHTHTTHRTRIPWKPNTIRYYPLVKNTFIVTQWLTLFFAWQYCFHWLPIHRTKPSQQLEN